MNRRKFRSKRNSRTTYRKNSENKRNRQATYQNNSGSKRWRRKKTRRIIFWMLVVLILILALFLVRNIYFFATESKLDPNNPYPIKGVDVSSYQKEIDWGGLESEGIRFAFIKATEGSNHVDSRFEYNWKEAHKTNMKVGAYHFLSYDTKGKAQADNYIDTVDKKIGMLPPVVDVEFYGDYINDNPSKKKVHKILNVVLKELEDRYNIRPVIYTNTHIYEMYISGEYDDYSIWISNPDIPEALPDGREWIFCQYTFKGTSQYVANGQKYVDMNVFNGSEWDFRTYNGK